jgi:hypothetical protein
MAITTTTLASAVVVTDVAVVLTSATGVTAGCSLKIDGENMRVIGSYTSGTTVPVSRGRDGTATKAHPATANVVIELPSDLTGQGPQTAAQWPNLVCREVQSYSASGAIALPRPGQDVIAVLNGTSTLTMTVANPTTDMDGTMLYVLSNGKGAHTLTVGGSSGVGNGGSTMDVGTYNTTEATGCALMALNGFWVLWANGIGSAGTQVAGVVFA